MTSDHDGQQYTWEDQNATSLGLAATDRVISHASSTPFIVAKVVKGIGEQLSKKIVVN